MATEDKTVPCPVCEGAGAWRGMTGIPVYDRTPDGKVPYDCTICLFCKGWGEVRVRREPGIGL